MNNELTVQQAFNTMRDFLEKYWERTSSDDIASILSDIQWLPDEETADPAAWQDWQESVAAALKGAAKSGKIECINNESYER